MTGPLDPRQESDLRAATGFHPFTIQRLLAVGDLLALPEGQVVVLQDIAPGDALLVASGELAVHHDGTSTAVLSVGEVVAVATLAARPPATTSLVATTSAQALLLTARSLAQVVDEDPDFATRLADVVVPAPTGPRTAGPVDRPDPTASPRRA